MAKPDPRALAGRLFAWETEAGYDPFHGAVQVYAEVLGDEGLAAYHELAERAWAKVPALSPESDGPGQNGARHRVTSVMETLARMSGDTDRLAEVKSRELSMPYQFLKSAEIHSEAGNQDLALQWAEQG